LVPVSEPHKGGGGTDGKRSGEVDEHVGGSPCRRMVGDDVQLTGLVRRLTGVQDETDAEDDGHGDDDGGAQAVPGRGALDGHGQFLS
jgi:hypothetical protein